MQAAMASGKLAPVKYVVERFMAFTETGRKRKQEPSLPGITYQYAQTFEQAEYLVNRGSLTWHLTRAAFRMEPAEGLRTLELIVKKGRKPWKYVLEDYPGFSNQYQFRDALVGIVLANGVKWPKHWYRCRCFDAMSLMVMVKHKSPAARDPKYLPIFRSLERRRAAVTTALATKLPQELVSRILRASGLALEGSGEFE